MGEEEQVNSDQVESKRLSFVDIRPYHVSSTLGRIADFQIDNPDSIISVALLKAEPKGVEDINSTIGLTVDGVNAKVYGLLRSQVPRVFSDEQIGAVEESFKGQEGIETRVERVSGDSGRGLMLSIKDSLGGVRSYALNFGKEGQEVGGISVSAGLDGAWGVDFTNKVADGEVFKAIVDTAPVLDVIASALEGAEPKSNGRHDLRSWVNLVSGREGNHASALEVDNNGRIINSSNYIIGKITNK